MITTITGTVITEVATMSHFTGTMSSILITRGHRNRPPSANLPTERNRWVPHTLTNLSLLLLVTSRCTHYLWIFELPNFHLFCLILPSNGVSDSVKAVVCRPDGAMLARARRVLRGRRRWRRERASHPQV